MYPRVKRVRRGDRTYEYLQLVEGHREDGKVRQRVVATLGRVDELKASGQLDRWAGAFARLDPPAVGTRREVGPLLLVAHYLRRLGLVGLVDDAAPMRGRSLLSHGEVITALVANRLAAPSPLYDVAGWASSAAGRAVRHPGRAAQRRPARAGPQSAGAGGRAGPWGPRVGRRARLRHRRRHPAAPGPDHGALRRGL